MPVVGQILSLANTLNLPDGTDVWMSTNPEIVSPHNRGCGSWAVTYETEGKAHVCIDPDAWVDDKFNIAHEFGHVISEMNGGPHHGCDWGSEGLFRATGVGHRCDCDYVNGYSHCPTSREFTGSAQNEGFAHFISAATFNYRNTSTSAFVFYKDVMKWSGTHGGILPGAPPLGWPPVYTFDHPFAVDLSEASNVKWTDYECDPSGDDFEHYGNEWDWLLFFWNLYTEGGDTNRFELSEIINMWDWVSDGNVADFCCTVDASGNPSVCAPRQKPYVCAKSPNFLPVQFEVGKLWEADSEFDVTEGVRNQAYSTYHATNPDKYEYFFNTADDARVNY